MDEQGFICEEGEEEEEEDILYWHGGNPSTLNPQPSTLNPQPKSRRKTEKLSGQRAGTSSLNRPT